jgi:hypothetical protein
LNNGTNTIDYRHENAKKTDVLTIATLEDGPVIRVQTCSRK